MVSFVEAAPVIPSTNPAVETMPSLAPRMAARSLLSWFPEVAIFLLVFSDDILTNYSDRNGSRQLMYYLHWCFGIIIL